LEGSKIKIKSVLQFLLKAAIALFSLWFIVHKVIHRENEMSFFGFVNTRIHTEGVYSILISVIILMVLNWSIEAIKWKFLINKLTKLSFVRSLSAVFAGATVSFFTPNRVGDYAGRMLFLPVSVRIASLLSTFVGNISQLIVTLCCGLAAMALSLQHYVQWNESLVVTTRVASFVFALILFISFPYIRVVFKMPLLNFVRQRFPEYVMHLENYSNKEMMQILFLSLLRYSVFAFQYILLFLVSGIPVVPSMIVIIALIFFIQALVPTLALTEFAIRGSVALIVVAPFIQNDEAVLMASFALWLINLAVPAAIGSLMIFYFNFRKE